ncbi:hypothetical protein ACOZB2_21620, partial [Pantoea endophytica]
CWCVLLWISLVINVILHVISDSTFRGATKIGLRTLRQKLATRVKMGHLDSEKKGVNKISG